MLYIHGEGYLQYNQNDTVNDAISKSPFEKTDLDLIVVGTSWEIQDSAIAESDPHPEINLSKLDIPKVFFLNKEYKKLDKKSKHAKRNKSDSVFTVHHNYRKWEEQTGSKFVQLTFAADPQRFKDYGLPKVYAFGFTGSLHKTYTDI